MIMYACIHVYVTVKTYCSGFPAYCQYYPMPDSLYWSTPKILGNL